MMYLNAMSDSNKVNCTVQSVTDTHAIALTSAGDEIACTMLDTDLKTGDRSHIIYRSERRDSNG